METMIAAMLMLSCTTIYEKNDTYLDKCIDHKSGVTCWIYKNGYAGGISCIPNKELLREHD